ncbi:MAG TPA: class II glutamine amidotransferase [Ktedonobacterales bacterium]|jgi:predicted glutamine amidotransferase
MCEMLAVHAGAPGQTFTLGEILPVAAEMDRLGIAGFGWGVAWHEPDTTHLHYYRSATPLRNDPASSDSALLQVHTDAAIVHLRRPSKLSTIGLDDAQPFYSERLGFAFAHNGDFVKHDTLRPRFQEQGLLQGRADTEVGFRLFEETLERKSGPKHAEHALREVHQTLEGRANLFALLADGSIAVLAEYEDNWMFRCQLGALDVIVTALYSWDRSVFNLILNDAQNIRRIEVGTSTTLTFKSGV